MTAARVSVKGPQKSLKLLQLEKRIAELKNVKTSHMYALRDARGETEIFCLAVAGKRPEVIQDIVFDKITGKDTDYFEEYLTLYMRYFQDSVPDFFFKILKRLVDREELYGVLIASMSLRSTVLRNVELANMLVAMVEQLGNPRLAFELKERRDWYIDHPLRVQT